MMSRWIRRLLRALPRRVQAPKRPEAHADLPQMSDRSYSGRANFRAPDDAPGL